MSTKTQKKQNVSPSSQESEMMVLGCMINSLSHLNLGCDSLKEDDFYFPEHKEIFIGLRNLYQEDKPADIHLLSEELRREKKLKQVGDIAYLTELSQYSGFSTLIEDYIQIVKDKSTLRKIIQTTQLISTHAAKDPKDVDDLLEEAQKLFFEIGKNAKTQLGVQIEQLISGSRSESGLSYLKEIEKRQDEFKAKGPDAPKVTGISTGFLDLDSMINGLGNSNLVILAARPAMGKTALALNMAENICLKSHRTVGIFSLEMTADQLLHRMIASQSSVEGEKIATGALNGQEYQRIVATVKNMQKSRMIIDDQPGLKITELRSRARRMKEVYDIEVLFIDYLQLLSGSGSRSSSDSRQNEISEISRMLKTLARELNIPIICLSQLSRKVEERTGHRPQMSDLRESGSIEQDADVVLLIMRKDYYDPEDKPGHCDLIVGKNRHGKTGNVQLTYRKEFAQFTNYIPTEASHAPY